MLDINSVVIYSPYGVCRVDSIIERKLGKETRQYYVLIPIGLDSANYLIPTNSPLIETKIKPILSRDAILELIKIIPEQQISWVDNDNERKQYFQEIIRKADRKELIALIKLIYSHQIDLRERKKKLHAIDEQYFRDAEKLIYDEISFVLQIDKSEVIPYIIGSVAQNQEI